MLESPRLYSGLEGSSADTLWAPKNTGHASFAWVHTVGMARAEASMADIQGVLGHESDKMARHYAGEARNF